MPHTFHQIGRLTALLLIVFSLIFVSGCGGSSDIGSISGSGDSGTPAASPAPGTVSPSIVAMENQVKVLINAERAKAGKPPLDWNDSLLGVEVLIAIGQKTTILKRWLTSGLKRAYVCLVAITSPFLVRAF